MSASQIIILIHSMQKSFHLISKFKLSLESIYVRQYNNLFINVQEERQAEKDALKKFFTEGEGQTAGVTSLFFRPCSSR